MKVLSENLFFSMTSDYLEKYIPNQHQDSPQTKKAYTDALTVFRRYVTDVSGIPMDKFKFTDLTYDFLLDYRDYLSQKYKPRTINHRLAAIIAYMKYVAIRRTEYSQIYLNVLDVPLVTVPSRIREIVEDKEPLTKLLDAPDSSKLGIRDKTILVLLYDTALRADELLQLNLSDVRIDVDEPYIRIHGKGDKERTVGLSDKTVPILKQYIPLFHKFRTDRSFPFIYTCIKGNIDRMSERNVERIVKKYGDIVRKEYPDLPNVIYPHMLRRTRITGWYRDGVPIETIAVIAGHASTKTTRKSYAIPSVKMLREGMSTGNGTDALPDASEEKEEALWKNDSELALLCGLR